MLLATHPFMIGREYLRSRLLSFLGSGQRQSGIMWGNTEPGCLICTYGSRHGKEAGYADEQQDDGTWLYIGQGTSGDQDPANPANAKMIAKKQSVLLFSTREPRASEVKANGGFGKLFKFRGDFNVVEHEVFIPDTGLRQGDKLLRFRLCPIDAELDTALEAERVSIARDIRTLRTRLLSRASADTKQSGNSKSFAVVREYRKRSNLVQEYALLRADGVCEGCRNPAPFTDAVGKGFLEVHHIWRLADDGPDEPGNVAALCPNCHRRAHHAHDKLNFQRSLASVVQEIESHFDSE